MGTKGNIRIEEYGAEGGEDALLEAHITGSLTQEELTGGTTLIDKHNGSNEMIHLSMLWMLCHHWMAGTRFAFNFYKNWTQLLLFHPGTELVIILSR